MLKWTRQHQRQSLHLLHSTISNSPANTQSNSLKVAAKKRYSTGNFPLPSTSKLNLKMPTMTHTLERRLHRRSLDNHLDSALEERRRSRHSLTSNHNKENFGVHFVRQSFGNTSFTALQDLSNGKSPRRSNEETPPPTLNIKRHNTNMDSAAGLNENMGSRFSDDFAEDDDISPLSRLRFRNKIKEDSLSSSRMGDVTLDRMLDAIIESARKEVKQSNKLKEQGEGNKENDNDQDNEESIHEMEVRTPQHLKRQRVVRRKNPKNTDKKSKKDKEHMRQGTREDLEKSEETKHKPDSQMHSGMIGLTLPNGIPSPETPTLHKYATYNALLSMDTPPQHSSFDTDNVGQRCSTPTLEETQATKRCLSFSCGSEEDEEANYKRCSVASSIASSTNEQLSGSCSSLSLNGNASRGSVDVAIYMEKNMLKVHVIRCRDLQRSNGASASSVNAYVKVALIRKSDNETQYFQRTAVHRHSSRPHFDHCFKFDLPDLTQALEDIDQEDRLQMAVWHRDRQLKRSEFLGCISFPLSILLHQQQLNGCYKLQSQASLNKPQAPTLEQHQNHQQTPINHYLGQQQLQLQLHHHRQRQQQQQPLLTATSLAPSSSSSNTAAASSTPPLVSSYYHQTMAAMTHMRNTDDAVSIDSMAAPVATSAGPGGLMEHHQQQPMILSKKALHQRDADENLFLRFLELDPPSTEVAQSTPGGRRLSNSKPIGRTPFTMTKKLTRTAERGFGFSIVWTHPPRVEKVEPGLSADRCGILPGDYVIFVDKHNVVTMPEADVLNLIRSQGATLTLEIFRRSGSGTGATAATGSSHTTTTATATTHRSLATTMPMNGKTSRMAASVTSINNVIEDIANVPGIKQMANPPRPPTVCSGGTISSVEAAKRRLNLPQVTFSKESIAPITDNRRRFLLQLISREQNFMSALHFGMQRFVQPLLERKDLITPNDHRTLFQNMDELLRLAEDILEQLCHDDQEPQMNFASRVYLSKTTAICAAYKKYCHGIKRADCVLVNKSRQTGSEFVAFITEPPVPRKRPDLTMFIHRPLQHFREILKLMQLLASNCASDTEEHKNFNSVINELQAAYREITVSSGLMEPLGEGRPLLTLQDLESRMVFTKCKPFTLAVQGRQWIFGGDLSRVEGRSVKPYWTLLFSDSIVFAKVSRDRVLFITEEPIPIANIVDSCFHMRKKTTEFRLTVDPNGRFAESPTGYCAPDLTKTPKKGGRRKSLVLRAPSLELKAVWQNLLQRQIFLVNAALGSTPLSSPLDSPDVLNTLVPLSDVGIASASIGSIKLSSMDSINQKNQQHTQQNHHEAPPHVSEQIEKLIDEKCRILNKTGTSKSSALHLANWMKGQLDKQQEQARFTITRSHTTDLSLTVEDTDHTDNELDERITYWTRQQLENRTKELNLTKENGKLTARPNFGGKRLSGVEELSMSDVSHSEAVSQISQSHSTTSDSQITVRSSPIVLDKLAVCRHCHKNCQKNNKTASASAFASALASATDHHEPSHLADNAFSPPSPTLSQREAAAAAAFNLVCNSLKIQHSQSSPLRCSKFNGSASRTSSVTSISSCTVTGDKPDHQAPPACSSKYDTESDVAQLLSDDTYASETTVDDEVHRVAKDKQPEGAADEANSSTTSSATSSTSSSDTTSSLPQEAKHHTAASPNAERLARGLDNLRILDEQNEALILNMNGHCNEAEEGYHTDRKKAESPARKHVNISPQKATETQELQQLNEMVKMSVTITESAKIIKIEQTTATPTKGHRSPKPPKSPITPKSDRSGSSSNKSKQFVACTCKCLPEDFANTTLSPEEAELKTCKIMESPKQSPKMPRALEGIVTKEKSITIMNEDPHKFCHCTCEEQSTAMEIHDDKDDDDMSLMLIGLAQLTPAAKLLNMKTPTAPMPTPTQSFSNFVENGFVPTIAIVPATPDSVLTKTSTNVWDNSSHITTSTATTNLLITNMPRQVVIENIPDDSCDESPLDEEPPYRPMSNTLRRYGTMSSLEKLPSEDRLDNEYELDDDDDDDDDDDENDDDDIDVEVDDEDEELMDKARADNIELDNEIRVVTKAIYGCDEAGSSSNSTTNAWSRRASNFVSGKMSFFEESRAFIDKYLGRWNQEQTENSNICITSDPEEQMDECTSGATSGEEVWGTPTSGGDNDDMHLANSENTHSSPTKSSNSLNDDDDTELMMDELLMAPPMSASTIRGLLPRRRLEPLFEEETESDEEKTQQESEELKKGETTTNGHYLEDSEAGSSSEEDEEEDEEEEEDQVNTADYDEEDEDQTSTEERLQPNLQTTILGPRPLRHPMAGPCLPQAVLKASSCEYLLEQRLTATTTTTTATTKLTEESLVMAATTPITTSTPSPLPTPTNISTPNVFTATIPRPVLEISAMTSSTIMSTTTTTKLMMSATMTMTSCSSTASITPTPQSPAVSSASIITSNESVTIRSDNDVCSSSRVLVVAAAEKSEVKILPRPAKFIPPPPPPRRLLLTQTNLKTSGIDTQAPPKAPQRQRKSGDFADNGSSVGATVSADVCTVRMATHMGNIHAPQHTAMKTTAKMTATATTTTTKSPTQDVYDTKGSSANQQKTSNVYYSTKQQQRQSSTIIETSLLSMMDSRSNAKTHSTSSTTVSMTKIRRQEQTKQGCKTKTPAAEKQEMPVEQEHEKDSTLICAQPERVGSALSPRLEMRLALNQDILGDEDLINYDTGQDPTTILVHDLSTFPRLTGRDLLNHSTINRVQPKEAVISYSQQRNSKMDTPTVNRRPRPHLNNNGTSIRSSDQTQVVAPASSMPFVGSARVAGVPQHLQPNRNTWSSSAFADRDRGANVSDANSSDDSKLSDLEILARREKIYCMSQLRSGSQVRRAKTTTTTMTAVVATTSNNLFNNPLTRTTSTTSMAGASDGDGTTRSKSDQRQRKIGRDETALMESGKAYKLINFIKRRNSEVPTSANNSQSSLNDSNSSSTPQHKQPLPMSPRKDNDKPSLNRRLWKQITKRRRSNSVSELVAS